MKTLYLRNVPDEVVERLAELAKRERMSTSAYAVRELESVARRAHNGALFDALPEVKISTEDILAAIDEGRAER